MELPHCPACGFEFPYEENDLRVCSNCAHQRDANAETDSGLTIVDSNGTPLQDGDTIIVIKDLKFRGGVVKKGTKVKNIKLVDADHDIDCRIDGIGAMSLKSEFVKKA